MTSPIERIAAALPQALFDQARISHGQHPYPLALTTLCRDEYTALAKRVMDAIGPLLAEEAAYLWPVTCAARNNEGHGPLVCYLTGPHEGHAFAGTAGLNLKAEAEDD